LSQTITFHIRVSIYFVRVFFFNSNSGGGVKLDPLGTSANNWPIIRAPGDYEDGEFGGMMIARGNRSTRGKPAPVRFVRHKSHMLPEREPEPPR
jgi:hypothetical protein